MCLDRIEGTEQWRSKPVPRSEINRSFYCPILVAYKGVVLFSGGETAGMQRGDWYTEGEDTLTALAADTGDVLWTAYHPPSGYRSPEDLLPKTYFNYGLVERENTLTRETEYLAFDLGAALLDGVAEKNLALRPRDRVYVFHRDNFLKTPMVKVRGQVQNPDEYELKKVSDAILGLASTGNEYFQANKPWALVKEDKEKCGGVLFNIASVGTCTPTVRSSCSAALALNANAGKTRPTTTTSDTITISL